VLINVPVRSEKQEHPERYIEDVFVKCVQQGKEPQRGQSFQKQPMAWAAADKGEKRPEKTGRRVDLDRWDPFLLGALIPNVFPVKPSSHILRFLSLTPPFTFTSSPCHRDHRLLPGYQQLFPRSRHNHEYFRVDSITSFLLHPASGATARYYLGAFRAALSTCAVRSRIANTNKPYLPIAQ
jgi:hypothetical protein